MSEIAVEGGPLTDAGQDWSAVIEACYREEHARLWRSLLLFGGDRDIASDAVSEAFTQALHGGGRIRDARRWVWSTAFTIARGELAERRSRATGVAAEPYELLEDTVDLVRALGTLSEKQRAAVVLHHYAGYSNRETAAIIGSTAAAVGVHLSRARHRLRQLLEDSDG